MRGTLAHVLGKPRRVGIIPAYAGNTGRPVQDDEGHEDHPRVCGEHETIETRLPAGQGSSPRMRGTLIERAEPLLDVGIIPAYAGNTQWRFECFLAHWDHPRVCGEHSAKASTVEA